MKNKKRIKALWLAGVSLLLAAAFALVPVNLFIINFPEWLTAVCSVLSCFGLFGWLLVMKTKFVTKIVLPVVFGTVTLVCLLAPHMIPYWNSYTFKEYSGKKLNYDEVLTYREAKEDLDVMLYDLQKVHPMFQDGLSEEIEENYRQALIRLQDCEKITANDLRREIQSIINFMHDAHTSTYNNWIADKYLKTYPQMQYNGYHIETVNGLTLDERIERAKPYSSYENEDGVNFSIISLATLVFFDYTEPYCFVWADEQGNQIVESYTEADFVLYPEYDGIWEQYFPANDEESVPFVYYEIDEEKSLAILTLNQCRYNQTYKDCVHNMFTEVREKNISNIAVDLRGNGGGSSLVANEFIKYLPVDSYTDGPFDARFGFLNIHSDGKLTNKKYEALTFDGNVYVLTNSGSFSAAKDFAMVIQDNRLGKIVGEPSSNAVNGYGEVVVFYLPNSGIYMQISSKKWYRVDADNSDVYVMPDFPCPGGEVFETLNGLIVP